MYVIEAYILWAILLSDQKFYRNKKFPGHENLIA
jgi:hypothetical protein